jgi:aminoglycoside/choline kinase family phosphotransferase
MDLHLIIADRQLVRSEKSLLVTWYPAKLIRRRVSYDDHRAGYDGAAAVLNSTFKSRSDP